MLFLYCIDKLTGICLTLHQAMRALYFVSVIFIVFVFGCGRTPKKEQPAPVASIPELLIYCENGMVSPILEISNYFETQYKCKIRIHNDCSKNLIGLINYSQQGDLFIPDSYQAIRKLTRANPRIIADSLFLGVNQMIFIVKKGNPEAFDGKLKSLGKREHAVLLANPETSSLGYETKKLLQNNQIYDPIMANVLALSVDSRGIIRSIVNGEASVAVDWLSSYYYNSNREAVDTLTLKTDYEFPRIFASVLASSQNPGLAHSFLATLSSGYGSEVFAKYGIHKRRTTIF